MSDLLLSDRLLWTVRRSACACLPPGDIFFPRQRELSTASLTPFLPDCVSSLPDPAPTAHTRRTSRLPGSGTSTVLSTTWSPT